MPTASADQPSLLTSRKAAAEWWLDTAGRAALTIADARRPAAVLIAPDGDVVVDGSPRTEKRRPRNLKVPQEYVKSLAGTDEGTWRAAHAVAASRWPTRRDSIPTFTILLTVMALSIATTTSAGSIPTIAGWTAAAACAAIAVAIAVHSRRSAVTIVQTSDQQATRIAGIDAARAVLGDSEDEDLYKTALHQWRAERDPMRPRNRLARLEELLAGASAEE